MFGKFNPDFEIQEISRINFKYLHSDEFKIIKQEEEKYVLEKWQYLKQFLKSKEVEECIEKAEKQLKKELELEKQKIYYANNAEKIKQQKRDHYSANREKGQQRYKEYRERNLEKERERSRKYMEDHKEEIKEKQNIYIEYHKEEIKKK